MLRRLRCVHPPDTPAFTMIELLVVIVILALLISLVTAVASKAIHQQKVRNTQQIMQNVTLAIEQFAAEDPLHEVYARKGSETFGKYPPYQLSGVASGNVNAVSEILEGAPPGGWGNNFLADRLYRDFGSPAGGLANSVQIENQRDGNDDSRALFAYLRAFSPDSLKVVPQERLHPINPQARDYMNPRGTGVAAGILDRLDVLAIHDAWGVPLDYMLYVKCEWRMPSGAITPSWVVTDRKPVLRSRGIKREVYDEWVRSNPTEPTERERRLSPPDKWLFSEPFCSPPAGVNENGVFTVFDATANGWARAVALAESYGYVPAQDVP